MLLWKRSNVTLKCYNYTGTLRSHCKCTNVPPENSGNDNWILMKSMHYAKSIFFFSPLGTLWSREFGILEVTPYFLHTQHNFRIHFTTNQSGCRSPNFAVYICLSALYIVYIYIYIIYCASLPSIGQAHYLTLSCNDVIKGFKFII